jgi:hypothetical protein
MSRRGGNDNPFSTDGFGGIDWSGGRNDPSGFSKANGSGSSPRDNWGPDAFGRGHLDSKPNRRSDRESKYSSERTVLDKPPNASVSRVRKSSAQAYTPDDWYKGPKEG